MKKMIVLMAITVMSQLVFAQAKPDVIQDASKKSAPAKSEKRMHHKKDKQAKKEMMKQLNLTDDQKTALKQMHKADKEKKLAILNDSKLTEAQKEEQLKAMHKEKQSNMKTVLTEGQQQTMQEFKAKRKAERKANHERKQKKSGASGPEAKPGAAQ